MELIYWVILWYIIGVLCFFVLSWYGNKYSTDIGMMTVRDFLMSITVGGLMGFIMIPIGFFLFKLLLRMD